MVSRLQRGLLAHATPSSCANVKLPITNKRTQPPSWPKEQSASAWRTLRMTGFWPRIQGDLSGFKITGLAEIPKNKGKMGQPVFASRVSQSVNGPRVILEERQDAEIRPKAGQQNQPSRERLLSARKADAGAKIYRGDQHQQECVRRPPVHVKVVARRKHDEQTQTLRGAPQER